MTKRMRLAYFSPLPPARTGIADYALELLPALADQADVTLYVDEPTTVAAHVVARWPVHSLAAYGAERWRYDAAVFHMGNSYFHEALYRVFCRYPGIVVLHDFSLHHFMVERSLRVGNYASYQRELAYALGHTGVQIGREVQHGRRDLPLFDWPLNERVIDLSLGLIAHSRYVIAQVQQRRADLPVRVIPQPKVARRDTVRRRVPAWPEQSLVFASAGQVTPSRHIDLALRAFAQVRESCPQARYLIVGEWCHPDLNLEQLLSDLQLQDVVHHLGFVDDLAEFDNWIASADVLVNLRHPTVGETSGVVLRALTAGVPVIVPDNGWYHELPESCCVKVPPLDLASLTTAMRDLALDVAQRGRLGEQAVIYAQQTLSPEHVAAQYIDFVNECITRWTAPRAP
jgi:glycosyltransferase involved in cell wall biosynthesis